MRGLRTLAGSLVLVAVGFGLGRMEWPSPRAAFAADDLKCTEEFSDEIKKRMESLYAAINPMPDVLKPKYVSATKSLNPYSVLVGGIDALADLESGRGVDPYTFAMLHIGDAADEILPHLGRDSENRLTYKNRVVRMYSEERMKKLDACRRELSGELKNIK